MQYGFLGSGGADLGGFAGHGGTSLTKFFIGGSYLKPLVSFFSGSSNDGVLIGHFDNTSGAPKTLTVEGDISSSGDLFVGGGDIFLQQNVTNDNAIGYNSTTDHIQIISQDIHLNPNNGVGVGQDGSQPGSFFNLVGSKITTPNLVNITGSTPGELHFGVSDLGGADGTDTVSGSTIGVIAFSGKTEYKQGGSYNPYSQNEEGTIGLDENQRLLAHIRGGADVQLFPSKDNLTKTGGFLAFHTANDSASYGGNTIGMAGNEQMRIDRRGNVGIGFEKIEKNNKLQVNKRIAISSSIFANQDTLGPSLVFTGLVSGSNVKAGARLPEFIIGQVKAGALIGAGNDNDDGDDIFDEIPGGSQSSSFEIRARKIPGFNEMKLDTGIPPELNVDTDDLVAMHIRTYPNRYNPVQSEYDLELSGSINPMHNGANFGFNTNNPNGFDVRVRNIQFGIPVDDNQYPENYPTLMNFKGPVQFRSEGAQTEHIFTDGIPGDTFDFIDYIYDFVQPPNGDSDDVIIDDDGETVQTNFIQVNSPNGDSYEWINPDLPLREDGNYTEKPLSWGWFWNRDLSTQIHRGLKYSATGSLISSSFHANKYSNPLTIWTASAGNTRFSYELSGDSDAKSGLFFSQKSASYMSADEHPTFPNNGDFLRRDVKYKWKVELNKSNTGFPDAPSNIEATSSNAFQYYDNISNLTEGDTFDVSPGDVTLDENVNVQDLVALVQYILGNLDLSDEQLANANVNDDDIINILDVIQIINIIVDGAIAEEENGRQRGYNVGPNRIFREEKLKLIS